MMFEKWIRLQNKSIQLEVFRRISHHLSTNELMSVMDAVSSGQHIVDAHIQRGLLDKYRIDLFRIREIVTEYYPDQVVD